jgi:hypothetical protein
VGRNASKENVVVVEFVLTYCIMLIIVASVTKNVNMGFLVGLGFVGMHEILEFIQLFWIMVIDSLNKLLHLNYLNIKVLDFEYVCVLCLFFLG